MAMSGERYVVDADGKRVAVLLDIVEYERLLGQLEERTSTQAHDAAEAAPGGVTAGTGIVHHQKSPGAGSERLREVIGVLSLKEPVQPRSWRLFDDDEDGSHRADSDARH
jgi:hypothetical protein